MLTLRGGSIVEALLQRVLAELRSDLAIENVRTLAHWHRLPTSEEYGQSVQWMANNLRDCGLETTVFSHPTDGSRAHWSYITPPHWECSEGWLETVDGSSRRLADFAVQPISVIQRSVSTDGIVQAEVILVEGTTPEVFTEAVRGRIILSDASPDVVQEYGIRRHGAIGWICDAMSSFPPVRPKGALSDALEWTLFPYSPGRPAMAWGFVVSPAEGKRLRQQCRSGGLVCRAFVDSSTGPGLLEGVEAFLPGTSVEEIWLIAHLCHPAPFAHDNASGAALLLECARTLASLLQSGKVGPLRRGIRFIFPVEIAGTIAYLAEKPDRATGVIAGLNLDMVGASQEKAGSVLCIDRPPDACPSCLPELLVCLYNRLDCFAGLSGNASYPLYRRTVTAFSGGSDHWVLGDPSVGIPTPMLIEWPDRYYHTTADRLENLDRRTLQRNGAAAATYALFLAMAEEEEWNWLQGQATGQFVADLGSLYSSVGPDRSAALRYRVERQKECLGWIPVDSTECESQLEAVAAALGAASAEALDQRLLPGLSAPEWGWPLKAADPGPISHFAHLGTLPDEAADAYRKESAHHAWAARNYFRRITHWMDGQRTLGQIAILLGLELGRRDDAFLLTHIRLLESLGLVTFERPPGSKEVVE